MSYARKGEGSDVYVISEGGNPRVYTCIGCPLVWKVGPDGGVYFGVWRTYDLSMLKSHLREHVEHGHKVPQHTFDRIDRELNMMCTLDKGGLA